MPTLADELMGKARIPLTPASRVHFCPDEEDDPAPESDVSLSARILEWCRYTRCAISMRTVVDEFGISPNDAGTYLQRLGRRGYLYRAYMAQSTGGRRMQVWRFNFARPPQG